MLAVVVAVIDEDAHVGKESFADFLVLSEPRHQVRLWRPRRVDKALVCWGNFAAR
jgi:hypothetical protein